MVNKGALLFWDAYLVETGENYVYWGEKQLDTEATGSVGLWIRSPASHQYLINCKVSGYRYERHEVGRVGAKFKVFGPDGNSQLFDFSHNSVPGYGLGSVHANEFDLFKSGKNAEAHLLFVLTAATSGWYGFQIVPQRVAQWAFFSCEVKNL